MAERRAMWTALVLIVVILLLATVVVIVSRRPRYDVRAEVAKAMLEPNQYRALVYFLYALTGHRPNQLWGMTAGLTEAPVRAMLQAFEAVVREHGHDVVLRRNPLTDDIHRLVEALTETPTVLRVCIAHAELLSEAFALMNSPKFRGRNEVFFDSPPLSAKTVNYILQKSVQQPT